MGPLVGRCVEYWSSSSKTWHVTNVIEQILENGEVHVKVRMKNKFFPVTSHHLRWSSDDMGMVVGKAASAATAASAASASPVEHAATQQPVRERGQHDEAAKNHAVSLLQSLGGMEGMLQKWTDSWPSQERRAELKTEMLKIFPKEPTPGVCYVPFHSLQASGKSIVKGNLHPRARPHCSESNVASGIQIV